MQSMQTCLRGCLILNSPGQEMQMEDMELYSVPSVPNSKSETQLQGKLRAAKTDYQLQVAPATAK